VIGFHCQQAAEKHLKALHVALKLAVPRTHDLDALLRALLDHVPGLQTIEEAASYLTGFAVVPRYPSFQPQTGDASARSGKACALVREILRKVLRTLGASPH